MAEYEYTLREVTLYIENANESLSVAQLDLDNDLGVSFFGWNTDRLKSGSWELRSEGRPAPTTRPNSFRTHPNDFYAAAINRAYYAIFYSANALLATKKLARSKHSGVLSAFRQHFIKTELLSADLSEIYGQVMDDRHESDYEILIATTKEDAEIDIRQARYFVDEVITWLRSPIR